MKPKWLKTKLLSANDYKSFRDKLKGQNTICREAKCPNIFDCWQRKTATFLILGKTCTRNCLYCNVKTGKTEKINKKEPEIIAKIVKNLGLKYTIVTSVTRDDLPDFGAGQFARTIRKVKGYSKVEVLIPDLKGNNGLLAKIISERPDVLGHNIEVVERFYSKIRPKGDYKRSLKLLNSIKKIDKKQISKSGFMVGFGENKEDIIKTLSDLKNANVDIATIGQYLQPSKEHFPVKKYYHPNKFKEFEEIGKKLGFRYILSGPLVRSSFMAESLFS